MAEQSAGQGIITTEAGVDSYDLILQRCCMKEYTEAAKRFYRSKIWTKTRDSYAQSVGELCERCLASGIYTPGKIVHHKIHLNDAGLRDPAIALSFDNLELLCQDCHNKEHHSTKPGRRYEFDANGNLIKTERPV